MTKLGIMQGRLVPPERGRFQAFPRERWADELALAPQVPLSYIEWIYDLYGADVESSSDLMIPICFKSTAAKTGVEIRALCADYFMDRPFLRRADSEREELIALLNKLLRLAKHVGIQRIVLPFVDASKIETQDDYQTVVRVLNAALPTAQGKTAYRTAPGDVARAHRFRASSRSASFNAGQSQLRFRKQFVAGICSGGGICGLRA